MAKGSRTGRGRAAAAATSEVYAWEDDPLSGPPLMRPAPDISKSPLAFSFDGAAVKPGLYKVGTPEFRYWVAAEALRRGADFWAKHIATDRWQPGQVLKVILDKGDDLNAYYDREALNFFHGPGPEGLVYSGESPDILCHELGHAILDAIKPQLFDAAGQESAAFHESFGDISAILSALQLQTVRTSVLAATRSQIHRASRLSRLAEQLGAAIRLQFPDAVDTDCLRNANNSFTYVDPINLPQMAPASHLSSEPHSFSRIFTGAFLDILAAMLSAKAASPGMPTEAELLDVSDEIATILVAAIRRAPIVSNFYSQVAAAMVDEAGGRNELYKPIVRSTFVQRAILSFNTAWDLDTPKVAVAAVSARQVEAHSKAPLTPIALPAQDYGFKDAPIVVDAPSHPRTFVARAQAVHGIGEVEPANSSTASIAFLNDLFGRDHIDCSKVEGGQKVNYGGRRRSHEIVKERGVYRLKRCHFHCGFCR